MLLDHRKLEIPGNRSPPVVLPLSKTAVPLLKKDLTLKKTETKSKAIAVKQRLREACTSSVETS